MNEQVKNEEVIAGDGFKRSLVIDTATNHPRPVWRSDRSNGNSPNAGTYQKHRDGDIVIVVTITPSETTLTFNTVVDGAMCHVKGGFNFHPVINNLTPLVREWLYSDESKPYLPKGVGWDGENPEIEQIKLEKALSVLPKGMPDELLGELISAIAYTSINEFNDVKVIHRGSQHMVDVPQDCDYIIQADKENNFICKSKPVMGPDMKSVVVTSDASHRLYIIWCTMLKNNVNKKITLEVIELS